MLLNAHACFIAVQSRKCDLPPKDLMFCKLCMVFSYCMLRAQCHLLASVLAIGTLIRPFETRQAWPFLLMAFGTLCPRRT